MKKGIFLLFLLIFNFCFFGKEPDQNANIIDQSELPQTGIVIYDNLRLRESFDLNSKIVRLLKIGDEFIVKSKSKRFQEINNIKSFWYKVKINNQEGWLFGAYVLFNYIKQNNLVYGIKIEPLNYNDTIFGEESNTYFINMENTLLIYSPIEKKVIQTISPESSSDKIKSVEISFDFNNLKQVYLKVHSELGIFTTSPINYLHNRYYKLNNDGTIGDIFFAYFEQVGMQDEPYAELNYINFEGNKIFLKYHYYEAVGYPELGEGDINIVYVTKNDKIELEKIESSVERIQEMHIEDNIVKFTDLEKKEKFNFSANEINSKFSWCYYNFIFDN